MSGKQQFPFMVDPNNNNRELLESDAIIKYLYDEYGDGNVSACLWPPCNVALKAASFQVSNVARSAWSELVCMWHRPHWPNKRIHAILVTTYVQLKGTSDPAPHP